MTTREPVMPSWSIFVWRIGKPRALAIAAGTREQGWVRPLVRRLHVGGVRYQF
ncbi:hypothetical protein [Rhodococcus sp. (in: high G+C Gram-positive bacteria)]|uniref:hypothetical protein n=1 Tax=Rhodococcus sp. TaxID=1831 RepID=UPI003BB05624